jgi:4-hydroxybenzoate polyprenyltransferase
MTTAAARPAQAHISGQALVWRRRARYLVWFFRISRGGNVVLLTVAIYCAAIFLLNPEQARLERLFHWRLFVAAVATACVAAGGYIINDYFDVQIDRINRPTQQLVGKRVPRRRALLLHWILSTVGVLLGVWAGQKVGLLELVAASLLYLYSAVLKRSPGWGNALIAGLTASGLLVPWLIFGHARPVLWVYVGFSFLVSMLREIIKDAEDMRGDAAFGCRTIPLVYGLPTTRRWARTLLVLLVAAAIGLPVLTNSMAALYNLVLLAPAFYFIKDLQGADTRHDFRKLSRLAKIIMALGVLGMVVA